MLDVEKENFLAGMLHKLCERTGTPKNDSPPAMESRVHRSPVAGATVETRASPGGGCACLVPARKNEKE